MQFADRAKLLNSPFDIGRPERTTAGLDLDIGARAAPTNPMSSSRSITLFEMIEEWAGIIGVG